MVKSYKHLKKSLRFAKISLTLFVPAVFVRILEVFGLTFSSEGSVWVTFGVLSTILSLGCAIFALFLFYMHLAYSE